LSFTAADRSTIDTTELPSIAPAHGASFIAAFHHAYRAALSSADRGPVSATEFGSVFPAFWKAHKAADI
jgi:hypothetical protein